MLMSRGQEQTSKEHLYQHHRTNTAVKFSTNLMTSLGLAKKNNRIESRIGKIWKREMEGSTVMNFKRGLPLVPTTATVKLNMTILSDARWGESKAIGDAYNMARKPPKYLPSILRDNSIISGISEARTVARSPLAKTHSRIRGSSSSISGLPPPPLGRSIGHGLFL